MISLQVAFRSPVFLGNGNKLVGQFGVQVCPILDRARLSGTTGVAVVRRGLPGVLFRRLPQLGLTQGSRCFCDRKAIKDEVQLGIHKSKLFLAGPLAGGV